MITGVNDQPKGPLLDDRRHRSHAPHAAHVTPELHAEQAGTDSRYEETAHGPQIAKSADGWVVRGQIEWDDEENGRVPRLVVDGKGYSWDELGRMLMSFEGFRLKMEVYDKSEDR